MIIKISSADKRIITENVNIDAYKVQMRLTIRSVAVTDYASYKCIANNSLGHTNGIIKLYRKFNFPWNRILRLRNTFSFAVSPAKVLYINELLRWTLHSARPLKYRRWKTSYRYSTETELHWLKTIKHSPSGSECTRQSPLAPRTGRT